MLTQGLPIRLCRSCRKDLLDTFLYGLSAPCPTRRPLLSKYTTLRPAYRFRQFSCGLSLRVSPEVEHERSVIQSDSNHHEHSQSSQAQRLSPQRHASTEQDAFKSEDTVYIDSPLADEPQSNPLTPDAEEARQLILEAIKTARLSSTYPIEVARVAFNYRHVIPLASELTDEERELYNQVVEAHDLSGGEFVEEARLRELGVEEIARQARNSFGAYLPERLLFKDELIVYRRLYGDPISVSVASLREEEDPDEELEGIDENENLGQELLQKDRDGTLQAVPPDISNIEQLNTQPLESSGNEEAESELPDDEPAEKLAKSPLASAEEVARLVNGTISEEDATEDLEEEEGENARLHPLTALGKWKTPQTIFLPQEYFVTPIRKILREFSKKHIDEMSERLFGGKGLPHSTSVASPRATIPQEPISIDPSQHSMGEMEANAYIAAVMPGTYTALTSILVEVRKRLGTEWLRSLLAMEDGPRILDAGAGGAGIIAIREILKAEHATLNPGENAKPAPLGRATVLTGSAALRHRASSFLENTTFLPRLPDYVHVRDHPTLSDDRPAPQRKQYDIILAPHSLWLLKEEWQRKQTVQNLWSLLSSDGGILILLEKGQPRGFEVVAGARELILDRFIQPSNSSAAEQPIDMTDNIRKVPGMIIAPCTNHDKCPMYLVPGVSKGRKDFCSFEQRYIRPQFLQRILKAKDRNHEDVKFSYVAFRKGVDFRSDADNSSPLRQDSSATKSAFVGYENLADIPTPPSASSSTSETSLDTPSTPQSISNLALTLPRLVYPPLKRRGHITFDVCTPSARIERWVIPKSFSKIAYRDARKAHWGDLWALGAKTRTMKKVRSGVKKSKEERKEMKRVARETRREEARQEAEMAGEDEDEDELGELAEAYDEEGGGGISAGGMEDWEREWEAELHAPAMKSRVRQIRDRPGRSENKFSKQLLGRGRLPTGSRDIVAQNASRPSGRRGRASRGQKAVATR